MATTTNIVSDVSGNHNDKIANAARVLGSSKSRIDVFIAIYAGKQKSKSVSEIVTATGLDNVRVLQETAKLAAANIINKEKVQGGLTFHKIDFYIHVKKQILRLASSKKKLNDFPTKVTPKIKGQDIKIVFPRKMVSIEELTIDDIDSFKKVLKIKSSKTSASNIKESLIKEGFKNIIGEKGTFTDWGGESNDLFSSRLIYKGKRRSVAFGFKGRATKGVLVPGKLGKNGDQIQRLLRSPAEIFIIQYHGQIDPSVLEQMKLIATAKSIAEGTKIFYCLIDGNDTGRLIEAYPKEFT